MMCVSAQEMRMAQEQAYKMPQIFIIQKRIGSKILLKFTEMIKGLFELSKMLAGLSWDL